MKLTFDPRYNVAYIQLKEKTEHVNSIKISEELIIDMSSDGTVYGIELLNANTQLKDKNSFHLRFFNEETGEEKAYDLAA